MVDDEVDLSPSGLEPEAGGIEEADPEPWTVDVGIADPLER
jgi:hypothetical protein